jgi:uncharacterized protein YbjT (DUF2867 family)
MTHPKILVTGATGRTGTAVVAELLKARYPVRALVRREDARAAALRVRGVEIAVPQITDRRSAFRWRTVATNTRAARCAMRPRRVRR